MSQLEEIKSIFYSVSSESADFNKWLNTPLASLNLQTPLRLIENGQADRVLDLLASFLPKTKLP